MAVVEKSEGIFYPATQAGIHERERIEVPSRKATGSTTTAIDGTGARKDSIVLPHRQVVHHWNGVPPHLLCISVSFFPLSSLKSLSRSFLSLFRASEIPDGTADTLLAAIYNRVAHAHPCVAGNIFISPAPSLSPFLFYQLAACIHRRIRSPVMFFTRFSPSFCHLPHTHTHIHTRIDT